MKKYVLGDESGRKGVSAEKNKEYLEKLSQMIQCNTVWTRNGENRSEFDKFYAVLENIFPNVSKKAQKLVFGDGCFFYVIEGKNAKKNVLLMSHHDVVDGGEDWETDPFCATEKDGYLFGRGTIDTKTPLFAELQAVEELLALYGRKLCSHSPKHKSLGQAFSKACGIQRRRLWSLSAESETPVL